MFSAGSMSTIIFYLNLSVSTSELLDITNNVDTLPPDARLYYKDAIKDGEITEWEQMQLYSLGL